MKYIFPFLDHVWNSLVRVTMFETNQTLVPEVLSYCKTLFIQHTSLLLGPATLWKEWGVSIIISFFIFIICILKMGILLQISFALNTSYSDQTSFCWVWLLKPSGLQRFLECTHVHLQLHFLSLVNSFCTGDCNGIAVSFFKVNLLWIKEQRNVYHNFLFTCMHYSF